MKKDLIKLLLILFLVGGAITWAQTAQRQCSATHDAALEKEAEAAQAEVYKMQYDAFMMKALTAKKITISVKNGLGIDNLLERAGWKMGQVGFKRLTKAQYVALTESVKKLNPTLFKGGRELRTGEEVIVPQPWF